MKTFPRNLVILSILVYTALAVTFHGIKPLPERARELLVARMLSSKECPVSCSDLQCPGRARHCKRGLLRDECNCCNVCARELGEVCGGKYYKHGKCAHALHCDLRSATTSNPVGVCVTKEDRK